MRQSVSRLDRFLAGVMIASAVMHAGVINLIAWIFGRNRMGRAMQLYMTHPKIQAGAAAVGVPDMADRAAAAMASLKAHSPESMEWQAFIQEYGANPEPDEVPALFAWMLEDSVLEDRRTELPMAAVVIALVDRHSDKAMAWRAQFSQLLQAAAAVCITCGQDRAGWNDYYMVRWFVLRDDDTVRELIRRTQQDGDVGATASWMVSSVSSQIPAFAEALERVGGYEHPKVDAEFDCGDTNVMVGPGPHQITRIPKGPNGFKPIPVPPHDAGVTMTPQQEAAAWGKVALIAECGPYRVLKQTPPGDHSNFWTFEITGPGFPEHGIAVIGTDETCGRSIIGGLATAWRAGRIEGRLEPPEADPALVIPSRLEPGQPFEMEAPCQNR